jgi:antibiotic biosynthesis monooxygenase (ABM) superfamily enzyme
VTICRYWRGWTTPDNADAYERVLRDQVIPNTIESRRIPGFLHIDVLRREAGEEVEFATLMWFDSIECIKSFVGEDHETAHVPDVARAILQRFDERVVHYEVIDRRPQ